MKYRKNRKSAEIAVIGMSCRFPGANDYNQFWRNLEKGINSITEVPKQRWDVDQYYSPTPQEPNKTISRWGGFVEGIEDFDTQFFSISPREAKNVDPQQRLLLELSWSCLEDAGYSARELSGSQTGVFIGACNYDSILLMNQNQEKIEGHSGTGTWSCMIPNRISSFFNFHGPSIPIDTACSSSLVAIHYAMNAIKESECEMALVGGISVLFTPTTYVQMSQQGMLSPTGQCKTFDQDADGYVRGEGAGMVLLKPLDKAIADGDRIYGVIKGSAVNHGGKARTLTSPNVYAQAQVLRTAYSKANISPDTISYIESHGTGTPLGDPIEINALKRSFRQLYQEYKVPAQKFYCGLGAVKSNIGHLEGASGIAGFIKILLSLQHKKLTKIVNFNGLNPRIKIQDSPFYIIDKTQKWKKLKTESGKKIPRRAGVSSFGIGGVNAHVIVEEAPRRARNPLKHLVKPSSGYHLFNLSTHSKTSLENLVKSYQTYLKKNPKTSLADLCYSLHQGRESNFPERLAIATKTPQELQQQLNLFLKQPDNSAVIRGKAFGEAPKIAFLFTGQGSQYPNMGKELYESQPVFKDTLETCNKLLKPYLKPSLLDLLYNPKYAETLHETEYTQPALFSVEYALAKLWESWGIQPDWVMGHSVGEYVAACIAGVFSLEDGLKLIAARGRLMQQLPPGGEMVSLLATESEVSELLAQVKTKKPVEIAAYNGPNSIVLSGEQKAVQAVIAHCEKMGIKTKQLQVSHAFHSVLMEPMLAEFRAVAEEIDFHSPNIPLISNVTGEAIAQEIASADYWLTHIRQPVYFAQSMATLEQQGCKTFLEIGPKPILLGMGRQCVADGVGSWLPSLRPQVAEEEQILASLGELYVQGCSVNWSSFYSEHQYTKISLPTYPFDRQRYWIESQPIQPKQNLITGKVLHPLLGEKLLLAGIDHQQRFESYLAETSPGYLKDHRVFDRAIFPATGYLEMAIACAKELFNAHHLVVEEVTIRQGLLLPENEVKRVQTLVTPISKQRYQFQIYSTSADRDDPTWTLHTEGKLLHSTSASQCQVDLKELEKTCTTEITCQDHYHQYQQRGLDYGESFQGVRQLWTGDGKIRAKLELAGEVTEDLKEYHLHPALLDAAFQVLGQAMESSQPDVTYLPIGIDQLTLYHRPGAKVWAIAELDPQTGKGNINLADDQGTLLVEIKGLTLVATTASALLRSLQPGLGEIYYRLSWEEMPLRYQPEAQPGKWLVFAPNGQLAEAVEKALKPQEQTCIWISAGKKFRKFKTPHYQINPTEKEHYQKLLQDHPDVTGIVHLWATAEVRVGAGSPRSRLEDQKMGEPALTHLASILHLVQALNQAKINPLLSLVTQGTQNVLDATEVTQPQYATVWGLGRSLVLEQPKLNCRRIDLDPNTAIESSIPGLAAELLSENPDDQIALRQGQRYVARLEHRKTPESHDRQPVQLKLSEYGSIDNLTWETLERRAPVAGEVEIEVKAVGLNFRDVLNALGMLKDYYAEHLGITHADELTFGFECAGTIVAVGEGVSEWKIGDRVMATLLNDGFSSYLTTPANRVIPLPKPLNFTQAATLPLTFLTAYYGLQELAKLKAGDKILIHSAAGGVGQAAVQIAQAAGAEIFATASPGKWDFLKSLGIHHIMNSRTLDFAQQIQDKTQGKGVNVVLNSLNGDFIDKSLEILAPKGRFVEIGKIGIWSAEEVKAKRPDVQYFPFDLGEVATAQPDIVTQLGNALAPQWENGTLNPLPHQTFASTDIKEAFRHMQQAKHIGKVVISLPEQPREVTIKPQATYLITGGLGALGLEIAEWMVKEGATHLVLTSRRSPSETAQAKIAQLENMGASITTVAADISTAKDNSQLLEQIAQILPPLKGIIHAAGVLDDGLLQSLTWEQFTKVMAPKVLGTWHLHQLTQELPLDFFICFSSIASLFGSAGQSNYAAANSFMDAIAHYRRGLGLPALTINWGPWGKVGMAANLSAELQQRLEESGLRSLDPEEGMRAISELLSASEAQMAVVPVEWPNFLRQLPEQQKHATFEKFSSRVHEESQEETEAENQAEENRLLDQLQAVPSAEREDLLLSLLEPKIAHLLGMKDGKIDPEKPLTMLGLDSLMAVELRNLLQRQLEVDIPIPKLIEGISILEIAQWVTQHLLLEQLSAVDHSLTEDSPEEDMEEITL
ncbi:type I polyketide synthase [Roseofilum capinflatum]|uniref:Type I polyketide synthase n=1 Tax=Roseofilum capinflatum BLCC-M114 TaxID=3022440 RepID=A0ABT7BAA6_9CYAN|nr:type I polyketide synthase [Roseofilum capinflatum]MDJ1175534.1 type I polyketide synthase [Roseofilum capinflatum BLCC-M114]